jgi:hypothetical protein
MDPGTREVATGGPQHRQLRVRPNDQDRVPDRLPKSERFLEQAGSVGPALFARRHDSASTHGLGQRYGVADLTTHRQRRNRSAAGRRCASVPETECGQGCLFQAHLAGVLSASS